MPKRDREAEWAESHNEMQDVRAIREKLEKPFESNLDGFLEKYQQLRDNPDLMREAKNGSRTLSEDDSGEVRSVSRIGAEPKTSYVEYRTPTKYAEVVQRLDRFPFSEDEDAYKEQMAIVEGALRTAMNELIIKAVATNTKRAFKQYCKRFQKTAGGLLVTYSVGGKDIAVTAKGNFYGDETICIQNTQNGLEASVVIIKDDKASDVSEQFDIQVRI